MEEKDLTPTLTARELEELAITQKRQEIAQQKLNVASQGISLLDNIVNVYGESKRIKRDITEIQCKTKIELARIAKGYSLCQQILLQTFGERNQALSKHYEVLDKALEEGNKEMIILSLQGISSIVVTNPLESFINTLKALENTKETLVLDF